LMRIRSARRQHCVTGGPATVFSRLACQSRSNCKELSDRYDRLWLDCHELVRRNENKHQVIADQVKELALLGCTVMGAPLITLMASFPEVVKRVDRWEEELEKIRFLVSELEKIEGVRQRGIRPKQHTLTHFETESFFKISETHKRRGYFLYDELRERKIVGIQPGLTKHFKLNTYGLTWDQVKYVRDAFFEIALKYGLKIH